MKLMCDDFLKFIDPYVDGEFEQRESLEFDLHVESCSSCRCKVEQHVKFKHQFKEVLGVQAAPDSLRASILVALEEEAKQKQPLSQAEPELRTIRQRFGRYGVMIAPLAAAFALVLFLPAFTIAPVSGNTSPAVEQTLDWHRGAYPLEIQSADTSHVSQWFHGKVDFPVRLPAFSDQRVRLIGARLAQIRNKRAAYVVYDVDGSRMGMMLFQAEGVSVPSSKIKRIGQRDVALMNSKGYDVAVMQDQGVTYALTSQLSQDRFVEVMKSAAGSDQSLHF